MTKGLNCSFDFYVIGLDTQQVYNAKCYEKGLELSKAIEIFREAVKTYPNSVIALGVNYETERKDLNNMGCGGCDLIQLIDGKIKFSKDYTKSSVLAGEGLICNNTVKILEREFAKER